MEATITRHPLNSVHDLHQSGQAFTIDNGVEHHMYTWMTYVDAEDGAYFGHTDVALRDLSFPDAQDCLQRIPDECIYPEPLPNITVFSDPVPADLYVKRPDFKSWDNFEGTNQLAMLYQGELEALELLQKHPHSNVARYHGALVRRGRVKGFVLDKYPITLKDAREGPSMIQLDKQQRDAIMRGISSGIKHLHALGLAHNDLNPANVMLDADHRPYLIDFGSCKPVGTSLMERGTRDWIDTHSGFSDCRHDQFGLEKIREWLEVKEEHAT